MRRAALLALFAAWVSGASCVHGLRVTGCVVDPPLKGYDCYHGRTGEEFRPFEDPRVLKCTSALDAEAFLKACKLEHVVLSIPWCTFGGGVFDCLRADGTHYTLSVDQATNYYCLSPKDIGRISQRCGKAYLGPQAGD